MDLLILLESSRHFFESPWIPIVILQFIHIRFAIVIMSYELDIKTSHGLIIQYFPFEQKQKTSIFEMGSRIICTLTPDN